jgi:serine/threonine-protein kinase
MPGSHFMHTPLSPAAPTLIADRYELREAIGRGASGTVHEAIDHRIGRLVAVKLLAPPETAEESARIRREAQLAGRLSHGNIVAIHDAGTHAAQPYIVMELVIGESLKTVLERGSLRPSEAVQVVAGVLDALDHAHAKGVVHRDVKPANILLAVDMRDGPGCPKLVDFGIARTSASDLTQVGTMAGTPAYMCPEALQGEPVDERGDIWAMGVVMFEALTGSHPFGPKSNPYALAHRILSAEPPPLSAVLPGGSQGLNAVLARALAKRPEDRCSSAAEMAAALRHLSFPAVPARSVPLEASHDETRHILRPSTALGDP